MDLLCVSFPNGRVFTVTIWVFTILILDVRTMFGFSSLKLPKHWFKFVALSQNLFISFIFFFFQKLRNFCFYVINIILYKSILYNKTYINIFKICYIFTNILREKSTYDMVTIHMHTIFIISIIIKFGCKNTKKTPKTNPKHLFYVSPPKIGTKIITTDYLKCLVVFGSVFQLISIIFCLISQ